MNGQVEPVSWPTPYRSVTPDVQITPGTVLYLAEGDFQYGSGVLRLRVEAVDLAISGHYAGQWVWLRGVELDEHGRPHGSRSALVRVAAIADAVQHPAR